VSEGRRKLNKVMYGGRLLPVVCILNRRDFIRPEIRSQSATRLHWILRCIVYVSNDLAERERESAL
jgi:hypothetical protein